MIRIGRYHKASSRDRDDYMLHFLSSSHSLSHLIFPLYRIAVFNPAKSTPRL